MFSVIYDDRIAVASIFDAIPAGWNVVDCRPLIDGPGNADELVQEILAIGLNQIRESKKVCFACDYGHSRSNFVAALAISKIGNIALKDAISITKANHIESSIKSCLLRFHGQGDRNHIPPKAYAITGSATPLGRLIKKEIRAKLKDATIIDADDPPSTEGIHDLTEGTLLKYQITDVFHCAYPVPMNSYESSQKSYHQLINLLQACIKSDCFLHYLSSWNVFEGSTANIVDESTQPSPFSPYSQAKCIQEQQLEYAFKSSGLQYRAYRMPCLLSRDGCPPRFLMYMADCAVQGKDIYVHKYINGYPVVPILDADDAVELLLDKVLYSQTADRIIHICGGTSNLSVAELGRRTASKYNIKVIESPVSRVTMTGTFKSKYQPDDKTVQTGSFKQKLDPIEFLDHVIKEIRLSAEPG